MKLWDLVAIVAPLLCHPGIWIRYGEKNFLALLFFDGSFKDF